MLNCIRHNFHTVSNHYGDNGEPDCELFSGGEWRTETICKTCGYTLPDDVMEYYKDKLN
jgi:hypothetical protein